MNAIFHITRLAAEIADVEVTMMNLAFAMHLHAGLHVHDDVILRDGANLHECTPMYYHQMIVIIVDAAMVPCVRAGGAQHTPVGQPATRGSCRAFVGSSFVIKRFKG